MRRKAKWLLFMVKPPKSLKALFSWKQTSQTRPQTYTCEVSLNNPLANLCGLFKQTTSPVSSSCGNMLICTPAHWLHNISQQMNSNISSLCDRCIYHSGNTPTCQQGLAVWLPLLSFKSSFDTACSRAHKLFLKLWCVHEIVSCLETARTQNSSCFS